MKMRKIVFVGLCLALVASIPVWASISGSKHDFSAAGWNTAGELCNVCHTPHSADTSVVDAPLWDHEVTAATFGLYSSGTIDATDIGQPNGASKLCLSCHDGTVNLDAFGGVTPGTTAIPAAAEIGIDLSGEHPVSFTYDTILANNDGELNDPNTATSGLGGTIREDMLISDKMQCSSCHDVHDTASIPKLLVIDNTNSDLCTTCHIK